LRKRPERRRFSWGGGKMCGLPDGANLGLLQARVKRTTTVLAKLHTRSVNKCRCPGHETNGRGSGLTKSALPAANRNLRVTWHLTIQDRFRHGEKGGRNLRDWPANCLRGRMASLLEFATMGGPGGGDALPGDQNRLRTHSLILPRNRQDAFRPRTFPGFTGIQLIRESAVRSHGGPAGTPPEWGARRQRITNGRTPEGVRLFGEDPRTATGRDDEGRAP